MVTSLNAQFNSDRMHAPAIPSMISRGRLDQFNASDLAIRLGVGGGLDCVHSIIKQIGNFFSHAYANLRMLIRAYTSVTNVTENENVNRRCEQIGKVRTLAQGNQFSELETAFRQLTKSTQDLFFIVDTNYIQQLRHERDPEQREEMRTEIIRECDQVTFFQNTLSPISLFFRTLMQIQVSSESDSSDVVEPIVEEPIPSVEISMNIPNTVPYVRNAIPADVQAKAEEINHLITRFERLSSPPPIPSYFQDPIMLSDFMTIPVFDASHPGVQSGLPSLRQALASRTNVAAVMEDQRSHRHAVQKDSLEGHIARGRPPRQYRGANLPAQCVKCRHPEEGGTQRQYLRIDTGLQDEILQFLRRAVS